MRAERPDPTRPRPTVCVSMITFDHEPYVARAIEGVLAQETDFDVLLVVGEDCSRDRTGEIVARYEREHPDRILLLPNERNLGAQRNFVRTIQACTGRYVALLDGDDYWTDPRKLAKQVALLEERPGLAMSFHAVRAETEGAGSEVVRPRGRRSVYRFADLAEWIRIQTSSVVFRREALPGFPDWFAAMPTGDWALFLIVAEHGDIGYVDEVLGVHRLHAGGAWAPMREDRVGALRSNVRTLQVLLESLPEGRRGAFRRSLRRRYYDLAHAHAARDETTAAWAAARRAWRGAPWDPRVTPAEPFKILLRLLAPRAFERLQALRPRARARGTGSGARA